MTETPQRQTIHPGGGIPDEQTRVRIKEWLKANGIDPDLVSTEHPVQVVTVPALSTGPNNENPWMIPVISLTQYYADSSGRREVNLVTRRPVTVKRAVPLQAPFPTALPTGDDR